MDYSLDAVGSPAGTGALQVVLPPDASVLRAFLHQPYRGDPTDAQRTVVLNGETVLLDKLPSLDGNPFLATGRADVTDIVAQLSPSGSPIDVPVSYDTSAAGGVSLLVVHTRPGLPRRQILLLDGGLRSVDETFVFLHEPILKDADFDASLALGIGFSHHGEAGHACAGHTVGGGAEVTTLEVAGQRVTSCAGGYDDGAAANGALITVGGVGDTTANPANPSATEGGTDDELYDVEPFLEDRSATFSLDTTNPSLNDLAFMAVLSVDLPPDADGDSYGDVNDNCPAVPNAQADADRDGIGDACDPTPQPSPTPTPTVEPTATPTAEPTPTPTPTPAPTVAGPPAPPGTLPATVADADGDGVRDEVDLCRQVADPAQADEDRDGVGDACDVLPPGDRPVVAGTTAAVRALEGEVLVHLPGTDGPPVPLAGAATVPIGAVVDARAGTVELTTAGTRRRRRATGRFAAGIFRIKQARRRAGRKARSLPTDVVLQTPPGGAQACSTGTIPAGLSPVKGAVRAVTATAVKGRFRVVGAAATATAAKGRWTTRDGCDGTRTTVAEGRATVRDLARRRTVTVRSGDSYLARARLFGARRNRP